MHSDLASHLRRRAVPLCASWLLLAGACGGSTAEPNDPTPATLTVVQGTNQAVQGGRELSNAIVLRVLTTDGKPVEKISVDRPRWRTRSSSG